MDRRSFLATGLAAGAAAISTAAARAEDKTQPLSKGKFKLKYAPHFGMFRHHAGKDLLGQLQFMADQGFTAMEDNGMMRRDKEVQEKVYNGTFMK